MSPLKSNSGFRFRSHLLGLASAALLPLVTNAGADTLFTFSTLQKLPSPPSGYDESLVSVSLAPNVSGPSTAADITAAGSVLPRFWNSEWAGFTITTTQGTTVDASNWLTRQAFTFTLTADSGYFLDLDSLSFLGARGGSSNTRGFEIFASVNGVNDFNTDLVLSVPNMDTAYTRTSPNPYSLDLSDARYEGITSVTFRYVPVANNTGSSVEFNGFTVEGGVVAVPEPSTLSMGIVALLGGVVVVRWRRRLSTR